MFPTVPFLSYVVAMSFSPGPNNTLSMATANRCGFRRSLPLRCGMFLGFLIVLTLCVVGNLALVSLVPRLKPLLGALGAVYLLYMAFGILRSHEGDKADGAPTTGFLAGMGLQLVNVKGILYGVTTISSFVVPHYSAVPQLMAFTLFLAIVPFVATSCWALFGVAVSRFLGRYGKQIDTAMALLLVYCAISISGLR